MLAGDVSEDGQVDLQIHVIDIQVFFVYLSIMDDRQHVELFHLLFLDRLGRRLDKSRYAVKGGCNLRFFHKSIRYSEDMDLDIGIEPPDVLRDKVTAILQGEPFRLTLMARGMEIEHVTESKQTDTVQRWKLGLRVGGAERPLPTKVEFSRRSLDPGVELGGIDPEIIREYRIAPILANHYDADTAARQKLEALRSRKTPQARDVFDLHLLRAAGVDVGRIWRGMRSPSGEVLSRILGVTHAVFAGQLLPYLPADAQAQYADPDMWEDIVLSLAGVIGEGRT
jgi:hypothetical protein